MQYSISTLDFPDTTKMSSQTPSFLSIVTRNITNFERKEVLLYIFLFLNYTSCLLVKYAAILDSKSCIMYIFF